MRGLHCNSPEGDGEPPKVISSRGTGSHNSNCVFKKITPAAVWRVDWTQGGGEAGRPVRRQLQLVVLEGDMTVTCTQCVAMEMEKRG